MAFKNLNSLLTVLLVTTTTAIAQRSPLRLLFQSPDNTPLENIATTRTGALIINSLSSPSSFFLADPSSANATISTLPPVPDATELTGIAEVSRDIFVVGAGASSPSTGEQIPGSAAVYAYDVSRSPPRISLVARVPSAGLLNGFAALPAQRRGANGTVLISDTITGQIFHVDPTSGQVESVFRAEANSTVPPPPFVRPGVNGIEYVPRLRTLFFANTGPILGAVSDPVFGSVRLDITPRGPGQLPRVRTVGTFRAVADGLQVDDFAARPDGTVFVCANRINTIRRIGLDGRGVDLAGGLNQTELSSPSSASFGRTRADSDTLYITSLGLIGTNQTGNGGRLFALPTGRGRADFDQDDEDDE